MWEGCGCVRGVWVCERGVGVRGVGVWEGCGCVRGVDVWEGCGCVRGVWVCERVVGVWEGCGCVRGVWACGKVGYHICNPKNSSLKEAVVANSGD